MLLAIEQDAHGLFEACLRFNDDLSASAARTGWLVNQLSLRIPGSDGQRHDRLVRILGTGSEYCRALSTYSGREGCILLVASHKCLAVFQDNGSSHTEMGIGCIRTTRRLNCHVY